MNSRSQPLNLPAIDSAPLLAVGTDQEQIPRGVESIDFEFGIGKTVVVRVEEDFEIIVMEDDRDVLS